MLEKITEKELAKAWEVLDSWQRVSYDYSDGTDEESPELFKAIETIKKHFDNQNAEIAKLQKWIDVGAKVSDCNRRRFVAIGETSLEVIEKLKTAKADARNEFAEEIYDFFCIDDNWREFRSQWLENDGCPWLAKTLNMLANGKSITSSNDGKMFRSMFYGIDIIEDGSEEK